MCSLVDYACPMFINFYRVDLKYKLKFPYWHIIDTYHLTRLSSGGISIGVLEHIMGNSEEGKASKVEKSSSPVVVSERNCYPGNLECLFTYGSPSFFILHGEYNGLLHSV